MNVTYQLTVQARCPTDDSMPDVYDVTITTNRLVTVERILDSVREWTREPVYQEDLTVALAQDLRVQVETRGIHYGVTVTCKAAA